MSEVKKQIDFSNRRFLVQQSDSSPDKILYLGRDLVNKKSVNLFLSDVLSMWGAGGEDGSVSFPLDSASVFALKSGHYKAKPDSDRDLFIVSPEVIFPDRTVHMFIVDGLEGEPKTFFYSYYLVGAVFSTHFSHFKFLSLFRNTFIALKKGKSVKVALRYSYDGVVLNSAILMLNRAASFITFNNEYAIGE